MVTNPVGARIVREWFPAAERGTVNAGFNAGAFAGPASSALIVGYLIQTVGWRLAFVAAGAIALIWLDGEPAGLSPSTQATASVGVPRRRRCPHRLRGARSRLRALP